MNAIWGRGRERADKQLHNASCERAVSEFSGGVTKYLFDVWLGISGKPPIRKARLTNSGTFFDLLKMRMFHCSLHLAIVQLA